MVFFWGAGGLHLVIGFFLFIFFFFFYFFIGNEGSGGNNGCFVCEWSFLRYTAGTCSGGYAAAELAALPLALMMHV